MKKFIITIVVIFLIIIIPVAGVFGFFTYGKNRNYIIELDTSYAYFTITNMKDNNDYAYTNKTDKRIEENGKIKIHDGTSDEEIIIEFYKGDSDTACGTATYNKKNKTITVSGTFGGTAYENQVFKRCSSLSQMKEVLDKNQE